MAENDNTSSRDLIDNGDTVTISKTRQKIALEATWEIERLCELLRTVVKPNDSMDEFAIRGLSARIEELDRIIMEAIYDHAGDTREHTGELAYRLRLKREEAMA